MSIAVKTSLPAAGSTEGAVITEDEVSISEEANTAVTAGDDLPRGKSAYEVAVDNGFSGSETEWLASLKGAKGDKGDTGAKGDKGATGEKGDTGEPGAKGDKGDPGEKGDKGDTGAAGKDGAPGEKGDKGDPGTPGKDGADGAPGKDGTNGKDGLTPNISIGTVTTLDAGASATAGITGTTPNLTLNLGIPKGAKGDPGEGGSGGGGTWYVKITQDDDGNITSDKTPDEIREAYEAGCAVYAEYSDIDRAGILSLSATGFSTIFTGTIGVFGSPLRALVMYVNGAWSAQFSALGNVVTELSNTSTDEEVPSAKCVYDTMNQGLQYAIPIAQQLGISGAQAGQLAKIKTVNEDGNPTSWEATDIATALSSSSTDEQVPSAKCVYDLIGNVTALIDAM